LGPTEGRTDPQLQNATNYVAAFIGSLVHFRDVTAAVTLRHAETQRNLYRSINSQAGKTHFGAGGRR